ncbi:nucleolar and coiled-body phosphoprotein 1 isoform X4 [Pleurodeles waltl]|uniref:nucleolar and coiled-body phosphoprotein 1 isoform X4 n=1 Tax=Pleurodeles waltl TaxID=8319 RepID=UPI003709A044
MALHNAVPSDLFPLVFSFLRENKLLSVAREFTKATGVKDQDPNAASLLDIFNNWLNSSGAKKRKLRSKEPSVIKKVKKDSSGSYESSSEDGEPLVKQPAFLLSGAKKIALGKPEVSSTKAGSCSIDDIDSDKKMKPPRKSVSVELKPTVAKHLSQKKPKRSNLVSESNSSSHSEVPRSKSTRKSGGKISTTTQKASNVKAAESSISSNSSDNEGSTPQKKSPAKKMQPLNSAVVKPAVCTPKLSCNKGLLTKMKESSNSDDSSDILEDEKATINSKPISDSSSEECEIRSKFSSKSLQAKAMVKPVPRKPMRPKNVSSSSDEGTVLSTGNSLKRKTEVSSGIQNGKERRLDSKALPQTPNTFLKVKAKKSQSAEPFRRVRDEEIEVDFRVGNNSFDAKRGAKGDWGEKANNVLKFTKGKSFRHEKTKKKRGNYCGGEISTSIKSIKFDSE